MADRIDPTEESGRIAGFLPNFYRTDANRKFLHATIEQLTQQGTVKTINGYVGRQNSKATTGNDIFIEAPSQIRQDYQLEPGLVIKDSLNNTKFFKDYQDYINQLSVFGGNVKNHSRLNSQEFYSWDPHIDWDKFTNFQNYYWLPYGPDVIHIKGESQLIRSSYTVKLESQLGNNAYVFTPDSLTRNPVINLYRGQTYEFTISSPGNPFSIKTLRSSGSLDRYTISGIDNYAVEEGKIVFTVPLNAPDILYYVSEFDIDLGGEFHIFAIDENTVINVEETIIGKKSYTLEDGTKLSNGMKISFIGKVYPETYANRQFYIEGVGTAIKLIDEKDLELISSYTESFSILFDSTPFDEVPFSDATAFPGINDYVTINRASKDRNPWSRYNRWFHKDVIEVSASYNGKVPDLDQSARAIRPIIEFEADIKLFNFGTKAIEDVDLVDTFTTDVMSTVEGSLGYNIDKIPVVNGQRILFAADTDKLVKNKIYRVNFIQVQTSSRTLSFIPLTSVTAKTNVITFSDPHLLSTKNAVVYNGNGNSSLEGLMSLQTYYVKDIDGYSLALYTDERLTKPATILSTTDKGRVYSFSLKHISVANDVNEGKTFSYSVYESNIETIADQVKFETSHGFTNGDYVQYINSSNTSFSGPIDGDYYYIHVIDDNTIEFYTEQSFTFNNRVNITLTLAKSPHLLVTYETNRQIHLEEETVPSVNDVVLVKQGLKNQGTMYWFDGTGWNKAQQKVKVNQSPKFDIVDESGISYGDTSVYTGSTFTGTSIFSYKVGSGANDSALNFPLSYKNIANIGDIVFNFDLATDVFEYKEFSNLVPKAINIGYLIKTNYLGEYEYINGWQKCTSKTTQAAVRIYKNSGLTNNFKLDLFDNSSDLDDLVVKLYVNGVRLDDIGNNQKIQTVNFASQLIAFKLPLQQEPIAIGTICQVISNSNPKYNGTFEVSSSNLTTVVLDYTSNPGIFDNSLPGDTNIFIIKDGKIGSPITVNSVENTVALSKIKFNIPKQSVAPTIGSYYKVEGINSLYNGIFEVIESTLESVVLKYPKEINEAVTGIAYLTKLNWVLVDDGYYKKIVLSSDINEADILTIKAYASQPINDLGYYEIPVNLQNNPLNEQIENFTLGEVIDHVNSITDGLSDFIGTHPGSNNLRDLGNITQYGTKFVQHSGPMSLGLYHITSESNNVIRAIEKARDDYNKFKKNFISFAEILDLDSENPITAVDLILEKINKDVPKTSPYYFSDMIPYGASIRTELSIIDYRIKTYPLSQPFNLTEMSTRSVLIYYSDNSKTRPVIKQLLHDHDYTFDDQGFVVIIAELKNDDSIIIYEYENTNGCFVPPTPTKLGIWPSFDPKIYEDTSLITPRIMIQGHDGSQTLAYGDYRDDLLIEIEKRIYNNIKIKYDTSIFDIADVIPGYNRKLDYSLDEFNQILSPNFYKWTSLIDRDFTKPLSFDANNPLTYNYQGHSAPDGSNVPGYWRGIYRWMLDTDRPNICPWEMLGFSDPPNWWNEVYGPAPYTSDNLQLWQDLTDGVVREPGKAAVVLPKYRRPFLIDHIPVDDQGDLISPLLSGMTAGFITTDIEGDYVFGDVSPVEAAWRRSSYYPFSVLIAATLMQPAKVFGTLLDRSRVIRNLAGQIVYKDTNLFVTPKDVKIPCIYVIPSSTYTAGIINYIADFILSDNLKSYSEYSYNLKNIQTRLSYRVGSFTSKEKFNLLLDSKTPLSSGSVFVPQEDYDIILNSSSPIKKITYSGVIVTKLSSGFEVKGYSQTQPYFYQYTWVNNGFSVNVGGISESYIIWTPENFYEIGKIVEYNKRYYRVKTRHTSTDIFDTSNFVLLPTLPIVGGRNAYFRQEWDRKNPIVIPYGTTFRTIQEVVDFLLGYGEWLKDQGFIFDDFNSELNAISNWETSAKEFMFWTTQNWSSTQDNWDEWLPNNPVRYGSIVRYNGDYYRAIRDVDSSPIFDFESYVLLEGLSSVGSAVISLSPAAAKLSFSTPLSTVDDIRNPFYVYEILKVDGSPIEPNFINSFRRDTSVSYAPQSEDGIYGASFYLVQKEQVVILNNSTIFNDTIYSPVTGYRQERIKVSGYVGSEWIGAFDVPGFIFDQAIVNEWEQWTDYRLGDIVKYKQFYYSAKQFIAGNDSFDDNNWVKLDKKPTPQLLPNWTYKATQFTDFYDLDSDNFDSDQQVMAQHLIGYQKRNYLDNIIKNSVSEYKFYQGMIIEKGTQNVFNKLFDVLSADNKESLKFYEEWAVRVGQYGASSAFENIEVVLDESKFKINPQGFELTNNPNYKSQDYIIRQIPSDIYVKPTNYKSKPWPIVANSNQYLRTPGYVRFNEVQLILKTVDDLLASTLWAENVQYYINGTVTYETKKYIALIDNVNAIPGVSSAWREFDISQFNEDDYIWCGFEGREWNVYRYINANLTVVDVVIAESTISIVLNELVQLSVGDIIGIDNVTGFTGFYRIKDIVLDTIVLEAEIESIEEFTEQNKIQIYKLVKCRYTSMDDLKDAPIVNAKDEDLIWVDHSTGTKSATWTYTSVYNTINLVNLYPSESLRFGKSVAVNRYASKAAVVDNTGDIVIFEKQQFTDSWLIAQTIQTPFISDYSPFETIPTNIIGDVTVMSADGRWLAVSSPRASYVTSNYVGLWSNSISYTAGQIVRHGFKYYRALYDYEYDSTTVIGKIEGNVLTVSTVNGAGVLNIGQVLYGQDTEGHQILSGTKVIAIGTINNSTLTRTYTVNKSQQVGLGTFTANNPTPAYNVTTWQELDFLPVDENGINSTLVEQGVVTLYEKDSIGTYNFIGSIISPQLNSYERFGTSVIFGDNQLFIGAVDFITKEGTVYQLDYGDIVKASAFYITPGSAGKIMKLSSIDGIRVGMTVKGNGFTSGQIVKEVYPADNIVIIDAEPDSDPYGLINFVVTSWAYSYKTIETTFVSYNNNTISITVDDVTGIEVGSLITGFGLFSGQTVQEISNNILTISSPPEITPTVGSSLYCTVLQRYYSIDSDDTEFGYALAMSSDYSTLAIASPAVTEIDVKGTVFVYKKTNQVYEFYQELQDNDLRFGESITISSDGTYIAVGSKLEDVAQQDEGQVSVYSKLSTGYALYQNLKAITPERTGWFGSKIAFMDDDTIVVYSQNAETYNVTTFDNSEAIFDAGTTRFATVNVNTGRVDVYDRYNSYWVFSESLSNHFERIDDYGQGFAVGKNSILVSVPNAIDGGLRSGKVFEYNKDNGFSWKILHTEIDKIDVRKIKQAFLYNKKNNQLVTYLDVLDPIQGKIPGIADQEISYKTFYDPATYSQGNSSVRVDTGMAWTNDYVGTLWWDLRNAKFLDCYSNDIVYRNSSWNTLFPGAGIDIYEWVETDLLPSEWNDLADTDEGLTLNISGTTLYSDEVYSVIRTYDNIAQSFTNTYYYWVKNKKTVPNTNNRFISASDISNLIANPRGYGYKYLSLTGEDSFSLTNVRPDLEDKDIVLSVEYWTVDNITQNIHTQWQLVTNDSNSNIPDRIEQKWIDSLCGKDDQGRPVPDLDLPIKLRYGIENRPRQGLFINRFEALKQLVEQINRVLIKYQVATERNISSLEKFDKEPSIITRLYDVILDTDAELRFSATGTFNKPQLTPRIENGKIIDVIINEKGKGYGKLYVKTYNSRGIATEWYGPDVTVTGSGKDASIKTVIDSQGRVIDVEIKNSGYSYDENTVLTMRNYAALVHSDSQADGQWSIYTYEPSTSTWSRTLTQSYDTRKYWYYTDWYDPNTNYNQYTAYKYSVDTFSDINTISPSIGDLIKIRITNTSNWILLEKYADSTAVDWTQTYKVVGAQNGTIQLSSLLYQFSSSRYGYDNTLYDSSIFDDAASIELRIILTTLKDEILIDTLKQEYLNAFFTGVRYAFSEQTHLDWVFKTSFIKAQHNVGELKEKVTYNNDNLSDFANYVSEVKPYRTKVREYISSYSKIDASKSSVTDFDLPATYDELAETEIKTRAIVANVVAGSIQSEDAELTKYPWKHWMDNVGYKVIDIQIIDGGSGYISEPVVKITGGGGSGVEARAFIANGKVNRIVLLNQGKDYLIAPSIILDGGLSDFGKAARASAVIGNGLVRTNLIKMKFDRITKTYFVTQLQVVESFVGTGSRIQFPLAWSPDVRIGYSSVTVNGIEVLRDDYKLISIKSKSSGTTKYSGSITFKVPPKKNAIIEVTYLKDWALLNAADRIQYYYDPGTGQLGKDLSQLMTGIDYGGVVVTGMDFSIDQGWDSLPYYSDKWDSFIPSSEDFMVTATSDQHEFTFPDYFLLPEGTNINVYHAYSNIETIVSNGQQTEFTYNFEDIYPPKIEVSISKSLISATNSNVAGSTLITVNSSVGIKVGDIVSIAPFVDKTLNQGTKVAQINGNTIVLDQIIYKNIPLTSNVIFSRRLVDPIDCSIKKDGKIILNSPLVSGSNITITTQARPVRIDDPNFTGDPIENKPSVVMATWIANGEARSITIPETVTVNSGDKVIFRKITSDGSVAPNIDDYDTALSGGNLSYTTATGIAADDIIIDGDGLITPTTSGAPEEVIPGQVVDTVAIKVYDKPRNSAATIKIDNYLADGLNTDFEITQHPNSAEAVIVKITEGYLNTATGIMQTTSTVLTNDDQYTVDYRNRLIKFRTAPVAGKTVSIFTIGFNGENILDIGHIAGNGQRTAFVTDALWTQPINYLIYIDGVIAPESTLVIESSTTHRAEIRFNSPPADGALVSYIIVEGSAQTFAVTQSERFVGNGTNTYNLQNNIGTSLLNESNMIVRVNQTILNGPNNSYFTISNNRLSYTIDKEKVRPFTVSTQDIVVIADGFILKPIVDYTTDVKGITVKISKNVYKKYTKKTLVISVKQDSGYVYVPQTTDSLGKIIFDTVYNQNDVIEIFGSYRHNVLDMESSLVRIDNNLSYEVDTVEYYSYMNLVSGILPLDREVIDDNYVWIMKNGRLLTHSIEYKLGNDRKSVILSESPVISDEFRIVTFGNNVSTSNVSYMQFKDMLNRMHFKRLNSNKQTLLAKDLLSTDLTIEVEDASNFDAPNPQMNKPGIIEIRGERIEYFKIQGNVLSQLRRGTLGTGTPAVHKLGAYVQDIGPSETIPYIDNISIEQIVSDGTNTVNLSFVPNKYSNVQWFEDFGYSYKGEYIESHSYLVNDVVDYNGNYYVNIVASNGKLPSNTMYWSLYTSISTEYGQSNDIEVFVGGYNVISDWESDVNYDVGDIVIVGSYSYKCINQHTSSLSFNTDKNYWTFFVGNIRLKKKSYKVHNNNLHSESPQGDVYFDPDFIVDGSSSSIKLTNNLKLGTRVTVVRKNGTAWDGNVKDSTNNVRNDRSKIGNFITAVPGAQYRDIVNYDLEKFVSYDSSKDTFDETDKDFE